MRRLHVTATAKEDLESIVEFVAEQSGSRHIAETLFERLFGRCEKLTGLPGTLGTARPELGSGLRSVSESSYVIFFRYLEDSFEVVNVLHGSRDIDTHFNPGEPR